MCSNELESEAIFVRAEKAEAQGSLEDAAALLFKAANLGHDGAQVNLGNYFSWGKGVAQSDAQAAYWYRRAYRSGSDIGAFNLALDKLKAGNDRAAMFWLKRAVAMRSGEAVLELAKLYMRKPRGRAKATDLLRMARGMTPSEISEEGKEAAERLFTSLTIDR